MAPCLTRSDEPLRAAIFERLGERVEVTDVALDGSWLVFVTIRVPDQPDGELRAVKEWVHTELQALAAAHPDHPVLAPHYVE